MNRSGSSTLSPLPSSGRTSQTPSPARPLSAGGNTHPGSGSSPQKGSSVGTSNASSGSRSKIPGYLASTAASTQHARTTPISTVHASYTQPSSNLTRPTSASLQRQQQVPVQRSSPSRPPTAGSTGSGGKLKKKGPPSPHVVIRDVEAEEEQERVARARSVVFPSFFGGQQQQQDTAASNAGGLAAAPMQQIAKSNYNGDHASHGVYASALDGAASSDDLPASNTSFLHPQRRGLSVDIPKDSPFLTAIKTEAVVAPFVAGTDLHALDSTAPSHPVAISQPTDHTSPSHQQQSSETNSNRSSLSSARRRSNISPRGMLAMTKHVNRFSPTKAPEGSNRNSATSSINSIAAHLEITVTSPQELRKMNYAKRFSLTSLIESPAVPSDGLAHEHEIVPADPVRASFEEADESKRQIHAMQPSGNPIVSPYAQQELMARLRLQSLLTSMQAPASKPSPTSSSSVSTASASPARPVLSSSEDDGLLMSPSAEITNSYPYASHISLSRTGVHPAIPSNQYRRVNQDRLLIRKRLMIPTEILDSISGTTNASSHKRRSAQQVFALGSGAQAAGLASSGYSLSRKDEVLFGCFDGSGVHGGEVASFLSDAFSEVFSAEIGSARMDARPLECIQYAFSRVSQLLLEQNNSSGHARLDTRRSGASALLALCTGGKLFVCNAGNCRAVLAYRNPSQPGLSFKQLSNDHVPSVAAPPKRSVLFQDDISRASPAPFPGHEADTKAIEGLGGVIDRVRDAKGQPVGHPLIFTRRSIGGTVEVLEPVSSCTRSFGCSLAYEVGVTSDPEITVYTLQPEIDEFLLLASDGIWSVLDNATVVRLVDQAANPLEAARYVVDAAVEKWKHEEDVIDDISITIVYFKQQQQQLQQQMAGSV